MTCGSWAIAGERSSDHVAGRALATDERDRAASGGAGAGAGLLPCHARAAFLDLGAEADLAEGGDGLLHALADHARHRDPLGRRFGLAAGPALADPEIDGRAP